MKYFCSYCGRELDFIPSDYENNGGFCDYECEDNWFFVGGPDPEKPANKED